MCLIALGWQCHVDLPLVVAANRDEFYARPTTPLHRWPDQPDIYAGRDALAGGTWLGTTSAGRFAALTNVREPGLPAGAGSRGHLVADFLASPLCAEDWLARHLKPAQAAQYSGFNLLFCDGERMMYASNRAPAQTLAPGCYVLSNHLLDTPWPKVSQIRRDFSAALPQLAHASLNSEAEAANAREALFRFLANPQIAADADLPTTGLSLDKERLLSAIFIASPDYGTRASTLLTRTSMGTGSSKRSISRIEERSFGPNGLPLQVSVISTGV